MMELLVASLCRSMMESFPNNASLFTTGGNLWQNNKNIYYASSYAPRYSQYKRLIQNKYKNLNLWQPSLTRHYKCIEGESPNQECNRKYIVKAALGVGPSFESKSNAFDPKNIFHSVKNFLVAFYKFCAIYAIAGIAISIISACLLAVENLSDISPLLFISILKVVLPFLFMAIYVGGVNQLSDIEIDKINKPYLPLASGQLSIAAGVIIIAFCSIMSFWIAWIIGSWPLNFALLSYFMWGTAYSVNAPLLRWKGHPVLAPMCYISNWAFIFPISFVHHMQTFVFKRTTIFSRQLIFVILFMSFYGVGIALCKDIPDMEGDKAFGINSFAVRFGPKRAFWVSVLLFGIAFGIALLTAATSSFLWSKVVTGSAHAILASILWYNAKSVDLRSEASITSFYMLAWKLLCAEHIIMPLVR